MITNASEYYSELYRIQDHNFQLRAVLVPSSERIYDINLNTRKVDAPEYLSVQTDHKAEVIYFRVDRYFDYMDLAEIPCVIQYINAAGEAHYAVPSYIDAYTEKGQDKLLIPWVIDGAATQAAGDVQFSIRFYKMSADDKFIYNFTTLPATAKVLHGMDPKEFKPEEDNFLTPGTVLELQQTIKDLQNLVTANLLYWTEA